MLSRSVSFCALLLWLFFSPKILADEFWQWSETVTLTSPCKLQFSAQYFPDNASARWPNARFSATSNCFNTPWQSQAPLRVLQQEQNVLYTIDEHFVCQKFSSNRWQPCTLHEAPLKNFYRTLWGPIRVASSNLKQMHDTEMHILIDRERGDRYEQFSDSFSENLWLRRWCGEPSDIVHHFERWTACVVKLNQQLVAFKHQLTLSHPAFETAQRVETP